MKPVEMLTVDDIQSHPVWEFPIGGQTLVRPVEDLPVDDLTSKLVGTQLVLANGTHVWGRVFNVEPRNRRKTEVFVCIGVYNNGWFNLARYFDFDYTTRGPDALAAFLRISIEDVFPISYDIRAHVIGDPEALAGQIHREPRERLSKAQVMTLLMEP